MADTYIEVPAGASSGGGGGDPTSVEITATGQVAGNLNLATTESKLLLTRITVSVSSGTSTDFDVQLFERDTFLAANLIYTAPGENTTSDGVDDMVQDLIYEDLDGTDEIHLKITDNDGGGSPQFSVSIKGIKLL